MWICENLHMKIGKFRDSFGCLPTTHVEAFLKGWPHNHVRGCILEELLVVKALHFTTMQSIREFWLYILPNATVSNI